MKQMENMAQEPRKSGLPKIKTLRLMSGSLRPLRWQMTCYLFLFRPQLQQRVWRLHLTLSTDQWRVSLERPTQADLLGLRPRRKPVTPWLRLVPNAQSVTSPAVDGEPEFEIIPLTPAWRTTWRKAA